MPCIVFESQRVLRRYCLTSNDDLFSFFFCSLPTRG